MGIKVDTKFLHNLRFADDIALIADRFIQAQRMLQELYAASVEFGLEIIYAKNPTYVKFGLQ